MSSVVEKANSRVTVPSTLKTNTICLLSSSLILLLSGLPLCLGLLNKVQMSHSVLVVLIGSREAHLLYSYEICTELLSHISDH